jgi:L-2-hydroxyglutarate oxidase LhgO
LPRSRRAARGIGKLIVATSEDEIPGVEKIEAAAKANGVDNLEWLSVAEATRMEPELNCVAALLSPSTGIVDSHALMLAYQGEAEDNGAMVAFKTPLLGGKVVADGFELEVGGDEPTTIRCRIWSTRPGFTRRRWRNRSRASRSTRSRPPISAAAAISRSPARRRSRRLIYPVPVPGGLGVHITLDLAGQARFGPDVEWIDEVDYSVDPRRCDSFYAAVRRYWPGLKDGALQPGYAGIRPKISGPNDPAADFSVQGPAEHGVPGLVNCYGIESPGLTASLAAGRRGRRKLSD